MNVQTPFGSKVIPMIRGKDDMRFPVIAEVHAYWDALRNGRAVPLRSEVDPRGIERALENAFVLERLAPGIARFRLAGSHLNDMIGMEVRGMPLTAFFNPAARDPISHALEAMFAGPQILDLTLTAETGIGKPVLAARMLILPLASNLGEVSRALGCFASIGPIGRAPRRFDIACVKATTVQGVPVPVMLPEPAGFAEPKSVFAAQRPQMKKPGEPRPALRLVKLDDWQPG